MNGQHLGAFLWLRWRLRVNQFKRGGTANAVVGVLLLVVAVLLAVALFFILFFVGRGALSGERPAVVMYMWDAVVVAFLFVWASGVLADLQRAEALSLDKFLHLPVSLAGAFLVNYLSNLLSVTLLLSVPAMLGLALGLAVSRGPLMLLLVPLLAAFFWMVTTLTYQFQGWLAALMANKRRRQTVIVLITAAFILLSQAPNLLNLLGPWKTQRLDDINRELKDRQEELKRELAAQKITPEEFGSRQKEVQQEYNARVMAAGQEMARRVAEVTRWANLVPPGWLPLGALSLAEGNVLPALLAMLGLTLIGAASLWRSYRTTVRLYTGQYTSGTRRADRAAPEAPAAGKTRVGLLERQIPFVSEQAAAVALAGFRSLLRAPESKMMLLSPVILVIAFGGMFLAHPPEDVPLGVRPLLAYGAINMALFTTMQVLDNQFGFDRDGFRVYVLSPARRREILLGKNLAFAPVGLGLGLIAVALVQLALPLRPDHFLAVLPQLLSMYLLFCLLANCVSILAPIRIAPGVMRPSQGAGWWFLLHIGFLLLFPLVLAVTLLPLAVEFVLAGVAEGRPVCLAGSVVLCVGVVYLYRLLLTAEGDWLQAREQKILQAVTTKAE
jgi:hypothetical protein